MLLERCAALDVHQASVSACVRVPGGQDGRRELNERFGTTTPDLLALSDWLRGHGVTHAAMEGTGVYWKSIYYALEDDFELLLVNAAHVKQVPGRKTDTKDAAWLCRLLECGLLRASFVPPKPIRELRDLTRYRKTLIRDRASEANRLHKVLEDAGVKLSSVASNVLGVSGRLMLDALCEGTPIRLRSPSWLVVGCGRSCRRCGGPWRAISATTMPSWSRRSSPTSTTWTRRSAPARRGSISRSPLSPRR